MKLLLAFLRLTCGLVLGLALLELTLRANSTLLMRGMGAPAPVDEPVMVSRYTIRLSDADLYYWSPKLIRPIPPGEDRIEAEVRFETDEFGFPNAAPPAAAGGHDGAGPFVFAGGTGGGPVAAAVRRADRLTAAQSLSETSRIEPKSQ